MMNCVFKSQTLAESDLLQEKSISWSISSDADHNYKAQIDTHQERERGDLALETRDSYLDCYTHLIGIRRLNKVALNFAKDSNRVIWTLNDSQSYDWSKSLENLGQ